MKVTFLGQAGLLIETAQCTVMIDPYLSDSVAKVNPANYRRAAVDPRFFDIRPDVMIFTHDHLDHYDPETAPVFLKRYRGMTVLSPSSVWRKARQEAPGHNYVEFNRHTQWTEYGLTFRAVKAAHSDPCAIGVIIDDGQKTYYITGDTLYNAEIFQDLPADIDTVFLPINGVGNNMNMLDAAAFVEKTGAKKAVPLHTGIKIAKELEQFKPMFFEEPVPPDSLEALKAVRDKSPVAISAGERLYTRWDYRRFFDLMPADYIQPDISHAGGIMELKKISAEAEARYIPFAPHNPSGPVANAATLQLAACCTNFSILEIMNADVTWRKDVTNEQLKYEDGCIYIPDGPGLGIEINEEACLEHPYQVHALRHYTGALTDIRPAKTEFYF